VTMPAASWPLVNGSAKDCRDEGGHTDVAATTSPQHWEGNVSADQVLSSKAINTSPHLHCRSELPRDHGGEVQGCHTL